MRVGLDKCKQLVDASCTPHVLPRVVDGLRGRRVGDHVHLLARRAVGRHARRRRAIEHLLHLCVAQRRRAREEVDALENAHAAALQALELNSFGVLPRGILLHIYDVVGEGDSEARLLKDPRRARVHLAVEEVVRAVGHGRLVPRGGRRRGRGALDTKVVEPAQLIRRKLNIKCRVVHLRELRPVVERQLIPAPVVLVDVKVVHRRLADLLIRGAALDAVVQGEVVVALIDRAFETTANKMDQQPEQPDVERGADLALSRQQVEHGHVGRDEADGHEVGDKRPWRRVQHFADGNQRLDQRVHRRKEAPELQRRPKFVS
mmetsp:Transcript_28035/g.61399  ORF Transcript_28035/g.61399 Transcript_28035/m.61399 type:complete len:318 (+) Transcript_28035:366-1319(+)